MTQWTALFTLANGTVIDYDSVGIVTLVEEDGRIKVREFKDITNPEKRDKFFKALSEDSQIA
jgi:hypothetical protein